MKGILINSTYFMLLSRLSFLEISNNVIANNVDVQKISSINKWILYIFGRLIMLLSLLLDIQRVKLFSFLKIGVKA